MRLKAAFRASVALAGVGVPSAVQAQTAVGEQPAPTAANSASRVTGYDAAFFAQFAPRTALDIVQHVPGFQLILGATQTDQGAIDVRGFAGTAGNVVINGARPSSKAESLQALLQRIPAQRVVRVEVGPGDLFGSDYAGKNQVLNIIESEASGIDANVNMTVRRLHTGRIVPDGSATVAMTRGPSSINLSAGLGHNVQINNGPDTVTDGIIGAVLERRFKTNFYYNHDPYVAGSWALQRAPDKAIRFNVRWQPSYFNLRQDNRASPVDGAAHDDNLFQHYRTPVLELGGDVTRPLAGGAIKLVGLATRRKRDNFDAYVARDGLIDDGAQIVGGFEQQQNARRNETIGRLSWTRANLAGFSFEAGAEAALNTLDNQLAVFEIGEAGERIPITLPIANATVKETRGEAYVSLGRNLSPALRIDGGVNYEYSKLKVRGDATADRKLAFIKPNLAIDWKPGRGWHAQLSVRRTVAQLDFYDFLSLADLKTDTVSGGNQDLEPQRSWESRLTVDHPLLGDGVVKLELGYDLVSRLQDRILITDDLGQSFDSPGNLGTGRRMFAHLIVDAPLGRLWTGLRVKFDGQVQRTRVDDPISGDPRNFTGYFPNWQWLIDARRDRGKLSYGFVVSDNQRTGIFRTDEFNYSYNGGPFMTAFVEYRVAPRTALTFDVENAIGTHGYLDRRIFIPNRADPGSVIHELRDRNSYPSFSITLKQTLGGGGGVAKSN
ncbi:MAG: outer membrane beta-barrel protein [Sphingomicrobium sp.]